jgi:protein-tyrosine phosphatase
MYEIRPWLLIGKYRETRDLALLQHHKVDALLHLADVVEQPGIESLCLVIDDGIDIDPAILRRGVDFVRRNKQDDRRVLIACGAGISRSVSFAIASLKEAEGLTLLESYQAILQHHPEAMPHPALWESLRQYYGEAMTFDEMWNQRNNVS